MAKFKLYLLNQTSLIESSSLSAMRIPISEFQISSSQYEDNLEQYWSLAKDEGNITQEHMRNRQTAMLLHNPYFCYTFDEKFQLHQNTQRTLTFSMARDIIREDRLEKNPFINYLYIGAQLLLEDKYDNHHLMTVSKISYEFHKLNTIFKYECQDSFNYQLARQNTGYEIINNIEDIDFIGAKSLDWWVRCKIQPECNISYDYIQLNQTRPGIKTTAYSADQYPDFHKTISFSASGTASSVLIALGEQYSLQLHVYERFHPSTNSNQGTIDKYYWFEPMKTLRPSGLKYSPDFNLQSFGLEHLGTSLSSVLNVQTNTIGEDLITIIPTVPAFFRTWFETEEWANSQFASGLFSSACQETVINWTLEETNIKENQIDSRGFKDGNFIYLPIPRNIQWDKKYDQIKFFTNGGLHSLIHISGFDDENNSMIGVSYSSKYQPWSFGTCAINDGGSIVFTSLNTPEECIDKNIWIRLELPSNIEEAITVIGTLYLSQYREPTIEELEFASIADQIPWLENRLIDFTYFYEHSIITLKQYRDLMNIFENDLRKANAKLLLYSQLYYQSIQTKTKIISNLSAQLDMVGATFHANLVKPFQIDGRIQETTEFNLALSDLFSNKETSIELIDYYATLADYVNKYITAEQTFLKNIYLFRKYFYESCGLGSLHHYTWVINEETDSDEKTDNDGGTDSDKYKYSFINRIDEYIKLNPTNYQKDIFIQTKINGVNKYTPFDKNNVVIDYNNPKYYYLNPQKADGYVLIDDNNKSQYGAWSKEATYYELQWEVPESHANFKQICNLLKNEDGSYAHEKITTTIKDDRERKFKLETLQKNDRGEITKIRISCYQHCLHTTEKEDQSVNLDASLSPINLSENRVFIKTNFAEMRQNYFYQTLINKNNTDNADNNNNTDNTNNTMLYNNRFIHRRLNDFDSLLQPANTDADADKWPSNFTSLNIDKNILTFLPNAKNWDSSRIDNDQELDIIYSESFPMTSWYYKETLKDDSIKYHNIPFVNVENCSTFMRRISVSAKERSNWLLWGGIGFGVAGAVAGSAIGTIVSGPTTGAIVGPAIGATIGVGLVHGICSLVWTYGDHGFGNSGWTYQNVYGKALNKDESFQNYYTGTEIVYASSEENYWNAVEDVEDPSTSSLEWSPTVAAGLLFTYLSYTKNKKDGYYYKTSYWRILTPRDTISKTDSIGIISLKNTNWIGNIQVCPESLSTAVNKSKTYNRIDSVIYYPLENNIVYVSGSDFDWTDKSSNIETLGNLGWKEKENYWLQKEYDYQTDYAIILKKENFKYQDFSAQEFSYDSISQIASAQYYDNTTMQPVNLLQLCTDITKGFYVTGLEDSDYSPLTDISNTEETAIENFEIYEQIDSQWVRRYTKNQLIARQDTYVRIDNTYEYNSFAPVTAVNTQCYRYKKDSNDSSNWVFDQLLKCQIVYSKDSDSDNNPWKLKINKNKISLNASECLEDLSSYTNAEYWYKYRHHESVICREKAMLIETNLTEYWTNAYYASKNCKYFLPEFWQPTVDQTKNYYSVNILSSHCDQDEEEYIFKSIDLSTVYVPIVSKINKQHKFQFKHVSQINDDQTVSIEQQYNLPLNEHVSLFDIANSNTTIRNIMDYLNILPEAENWIGINVKNDYVMYEYIEGGSLWTEELQKLSKNALHYPDQFGGWYDMMIRVLMSCNYTNYSPILYKQAQEEHNQIWARLYAQYPHLLLEQSYSNENATTSEELLRMAQYAFRDYTQVESNYNITVIDPWTLKGYKGQELHIGDGIEVEATELYDDHDSDIYRSLIQYLYITDISYDLRKDDNIQLTVNSIKYQDKVIGQLIKLIR